MNFPPVKYDTIALKGGMDQLTPTLSLATGHCRRANNFECSITGGYSRIEGYERYDGHAKPSDAVYRILTVNLTAAIAVGDTVTGMTSGATGKVIYVNGSTIVVTRVTLVFTSTEGVSVGGTQKGTNTSVTSSDTDPLTNATYTGLAADEYRTSIAAVPGAGSILGVCYYNSNLYAWRNKADNTVAEMYVSSSSGWAKITFNEEISFTNANVSLGEGDTLTQGGVTATVARLVVDTGTLVSGTNTGHMVITGRAGGHFAAGAATSTGAGALTLSGVEVAQSLLPGGTFRSCVANFGAGPLNKRMYVADGKNRAFEFDGTYMITVRTGMTADTPNLIVAHKNHLFLAFGYSLQFSAANLPFMFSPIIGAGELAMKSDITNLVVLPGDQTTGAIGVFTRDETAILYGTGASSFQLATFNTGAGAIYDTGQNLEQTYFLNEQGIVAMATTKDFGNFAPSSLTMNIRPFISAQLPYAISSGLNREKGQYRVFFSNGAGLYMSMRSGNFMGVMPVQFPNAVICMTEASPGVSFFGSTNGIVYEIDKGTSFDGAAISAYASLSFNGTGSHRVLKRYRKAALEVSGQNYAKFNFGYDLGYASTDIAQPTDSSYTSTLGQSYWDAFTWDAYVWDGREVSPTEIEMYGTAENVSFHIFSDSAVIQPFTINTITTHYTPRRGLR